MKNFAVIDTETNWDYEVMSIGVVIADAKTFNLIDKKYYIIKPQYLTGGMFSDTLRNIDSKLIIECSRAKAIADLVNWLAKYEVNSLYAYNATFDYTHLPELSKFMWFDIMRLAAYRQYNHKISEEDCYSTGRLKRNYGVESILKLLKSDEGYCETHNALNDAADELLIMKLLRHSPEDYIELEKSKRNHQALNEAAASSEQKVLSEFEEYSFKVTELSHGRIRVIRLVGGIKGFASCQCVQCGHKWLVRAEKYLNEEGNCPKCIIK